MESLTKIPALLDAKLIGEELTAQEQFILARSQIEQALSLRDQGKLDDALSWYEQALRVNPDNFEAHDNAGRVRASKEAAMFRSLWEGRTTLELLDLDPAPIQEGDAT